MGRGPCSRPMSKQDEELDAPIERSPSEARQGEVSGRVVTVLAVSLGLILLLFGLALMLFTGS